METESNLKQSSEGADTSAGRKRDRSLIEFPYSDLTRGIEFAEALAKSGGKVWIEQTQLAVALDMTVAGGTFRGRLSAARMFGFVDVEAGKVRISELGLRVLEDGTSKVAKSDAFLNVPLYKAMYDTYNGLTLPPATVIERQMQQLGVPPKQVERARQAFAVSAQASGFIAQNGRFSKPTNANASATIPEIKDDNGIVTAHTHQQYPPTILPPLITEKALEYRLVDLMGEAANDPETMSAIIKVITFLKTRNTEDKTIRGSAHNG